MLCEAPCLRVSISRPTTDYYRKNSLKSATGSTILEPSWVYHDSQCQTRNGDSGIVGQGDQSAPVMVWPNSAASMSQHMPPPLLLAPFGEKLRGLDVLPLP